MDMNTDVRTIHEIGKRNNQEDCLYPLLADGTTSQPFYILCDGVGGHVNGTLASSTVCRIFGDRMTAIIDDGKTIEKQDIIDTLAETYRVMNELDDEETEKKMGTTLTFVSFSPEGAIVAHIGDSRIYQIRPSAKTPILYKSMDHSLANDLYRIGEITEEQLATSKSRHILTRAIQPNQDYPSEAEIHFLSDVQPGDYFYMCSDGMLENITDNELVEIFRKDTNLDEKKQLLLENSRENKDNHTAFIIQVKEPDNSSVDNIEKQLITVQSQDVQNREVVYRPNPFASIKLHVFLVLLLALAVLILWYVFTSTPSSPSM